MAQSVVSGWEIAIKRALGKLDAPGDLEAAIGMQGFEPLLLTFHHAAQAGGLPPHHRDPLDRMRPHVTRRKISAATRPEAGRDTFLGLMQICMKPGTSFRDDLGHRLHVPDTARVPYPPPDLVRQELAVP